LFDGAQRKTITVVVSRTPVELVPTLTKGKVLAKKYQLQRRGGVGGMADVWIATNSATGAKVCVKAIIAPVGQSESVERFRREAHACARLTHRAIVRTFDLLELDADGNVTSSDQAVCLALVMELLAGEPLGTRLERERKLSLDDALDLFLPVLAGLAHAHRRGIVHRDIKPDNVFIARDPDGTVLPKILDFGISKSLRGAELPLTLAGVALGTPAFMSPEQSKGARSVDARSDVFSAATVLHLMLTGRNAFEASGLEATFDAIVNRPIERPEEIPPHVWRVIAAAWTKDPSERFATAEEFAAALADATGRQAPTSERLLRAEPASRTLTPAAAERDGLDGPSQTTTAGGRSDEPSLALLRAHRRLVLAIAAAVLPIGVLLATVAVVTSRSDRAPAPSSNATPRSRSDEEEERTTVQVPAFATPSASPTASASPAVESSAPSASAPPQPRRPRPRLGSDPGF
jgi:serine/threonine-protein kinase